MTSEALEPRPGIDHMYQWHISWTRERSRKQQIFIVAKHRTLKRNKAMHPVTVRWTE
jgi:hypothetical protein